MEETLAQLSYQGHGEVPTMFPWWTNEMTYIIWFTGGEVFVTDDGTSGHSRSLRSEQKGVVLMKDAIRKFTSPGQHSLPLIQLHLLHQRPAWC